MNQSENVKEYPILFKPAMVKAILDDRKSQTRRTKEKPWQVGDYLWVRETWAQPYAEEGNGETFYRADGEKDLTWKPSIHMPRELSRITLEVTGIRKERLQDISEDDAKAEGVTIHFDAVAAASMASETPARMEFWALWQSIYGKTEFRWENNPVVWVYEFKRVQP